MGFDAYAGQVRNLFPDDNAILEDVIDGLFPSQKQMAFTIKMKWPLWMRLPIFSALKQSNMSALKLRHMEAEEGNAYEILGADASWDNAALKQHYREQLKAHHPDKMIARGFPEEFIAISTQRCANKPRLGAYQFGARDMSFTSDCDLECRVREAVNFENG